MGSAISHVAALKLPPPAAFDPAVQRHGLARRTLMVGTGGRAAELAGALKAEGHCVVGAVDVQRLPDLAAELPDVTWLGTLADLGAVALHHAVDEICVALPMRSCFDEWVQTEAVGRELGIPVSLYFDWVGDARHVRLTRLPTSALVRCNEHPASLGHARLLKRAFDIVVAAGALLLTLPLLVVTALLVRLTSPGPVFFTQPRVGRGRRVFGMLKFRTMVQDAEARRADLHAMNAATGIMFKIARDPRLTVIGSFLRRTSIDELPQLINVLTGDMSLVGPRPIPTWVYEQIDEPRFHRRFSVQPGMTGLWQVHGRPQEYRLMAQYDLRYVEQWSLWLDLKILARTIPAVLRRQGAE